MGKRIFITNDRLGSGETELGRLLMRNFMYSLARNPAKPSAVMLANEGVRLACEGSEVLDDLQLLAQAGVPIKACGTCLDFLGIADALRIGDIGTMPQAVEALLGGDEIVTIA